MTDGVTGIILAGGLARRLGHADKAFVTINGRPVLDMVIERLGPQVSQIVVNANGDAARFSAYGLPVAPDTIDGFAGPLAGVLSGMEWTAENAPENGWIATIAVDTPFFPGDMVASMARKAQETGADLVCAASGGRHHPVAGLWPVALAADLRRAMLEEDMRKVDLWTARHKLAVCEFPVTGFDPFFNINRPEDIARAESIAAGEPE